ncbi:MAG TPA: redoxin domain-containing protein [Archangium sp.]
MLTVQEGHPFPRLSLARQGARFEPPRGRSGTLFYFMRTGDCPVCRAHVRRLAQLWPEFSAAGFSVIVVTADEKDAAEVEQTLRSPFPVAWGVEAHRGLGFGRVLFGTIQQSGTVITNAEGTIVKLVRSTLPSNAFPEDEVIHLVQQHAVRGA